MLISLNEDQLEMPAQPLAHFLKSCAEIERQARLSSEIDNLAQEYKSLQLHSASIVDQSEKLYAFYSPLLPQKVMGSFNTFLTQ